MNDKTAIIDQRPTTNDPIHVALAVYDPAGTYSQHAGVTITSIFENTKSKVIVHILHDETLTEDNRKRFIRTAEKYNQTIEFIDISEYVERINNNITQFFRNKYSVGAMYRFLIPSLLEYKKVIYLDCDILVNLDISELWNVELENKCLAGVIDEGIYEAKRFSYWDVVCRLNGCIPSLYINSGVLLMNLEHIRETGDFMRISEEWLNRHKHSSNYIDQDILNSVFIDSIKRIDRKYNRHKELYDDDLSGSIIHPIWQKPWQQLEDSQPVKIYWDMYLRSAWGENLTPHELIEKLSIISGSMKDSLIHSHEMHHSFKQCLHRIIAGIWHKITFSEKRKVIKLILKDKIYRLKYKFRH